MEQAKSQWFMLGLVLLLEHEKQCILNEQK